MTETQEEKEKIDGYIKQLNSDLENIRELNSRLSKVAKVLEQFRIGDVIQNYNSPGRVLLVNFLAGLARGLGLTVGTAIVLTALGFILKEFISVPIIGEYISRIMDYVKYFQIQR